MTDHGALTGLTDDDHTQYLRKDVLSAKGDLYVRNASGVIVRVPVGSNGQRLVADSAQAEGVKWATPLDSWITSDLAIVDKPLSSSAWTNTIVTASATPHTKGAYTTLVASTSGDASMLRLGFTGVSSSGVATPMLVDIAIGPAGSEVVLVPDINVGYTSGAVWLIPVDIPAGIRISARCQAAVVSDTVSVALFTLNGSNKTLTSVTPLGLVAAGSRGTTVVSGVSGSEGAWTTIVASTAEDYDLVYWAVGGAADTTVQDSNALLDIAKGAAASEVPILSNLQLVASTAEIVNYEGPSPLYGVSVPAGTRLSVRIQQAASGAQSYDVVLYGIH